MSPIFFKGEGANEKIEVIIEQNRQLRLINDNLESQVQQGQMEIAEFDSTEDKYLQQVH